MRPRLFALIVGAAIGGSSALYGQTNASPSAQAAFNAIILTPVGALPQVVLARRTLDSTARLAAALRYGQYSFNNGPGSFSNVGLSGMLRLSSRMLATATVGQRSCGTCEGLKMGGLDLEVSLFHKSAGGDIGGDTDIGLRVSSGIGQANTSDVTATAIGVGIPVAVSLLQPEKSVLTMHLAPSLAYGTMKNNGVSDGGVRLVISAGIAYVFGFGLGVHLSGHRVTIEESPTQFGASLSWRFGASTSQ